ncbi:type II toxin-antitoxin system VapC family toxin [Candidatus Bathyarchaeota archaeon]|nr:type II toxin-antitoxin system VapC family toxin [Candidatus Bathyarchaeota archaeon]
MAQVQVFVLDASVAVKWYVEEDLRDKALRLRDDFLSGAVDLEAPSLILYEVGNAIRHHPGATEDECANAVIQLRNLGIVIREPDDPCMKIAAKMAFEEKLTFYDAIYLSVAKSSKAKYLTADKELYDQLSKKNRALSMLLKDYE